MRNFLRNRKYVLLLTLALSGFACLFSFFFRRPGLSVFLLLLTLVFSGLTAFVQAERREFADCHRSDTMTLLLIPAACLIAMSGALRIAFRKMNLLGCAELLTGILVSLHGKTIVSGKKSIGPFYAAVTALSVIRLIVLFRVWDIIPDIASYYRPLFASIVFTLYFSLLMISVIGLGKRRNQVFFAISGAVLSAASVRGELFSGSLFYVGSLLFFLSELYSLLAKRRRTRKEPAVPEEREGAVLIASDGVAPLDLSMKEEGEKGGEIEDA